MVTTTRLVCFSEVLFLDIGIYFFLFFFFFVVPTHYLVYRMVNFLIDQVGTILYFSPIYTYFVIYLFLSNFYWYMFNNQNSFLTLLLFQKKNLIQFFFFKKRLTSLLYVEVSSYLLPVSFYMVPNVRQSVHIDTHSVNKVDSPEPIKMYQDLNTSVILFFNRETGGHLSIAQPSTLAQFSLSSIWPGSC